MRNRLLGIADFASLALIAAGLALEWWTDWRGDYLVVVGLPIAFVVACVRFPWKTLDQNNKNSN